MPSIPVAIQIVSVLTPPGVCRQQGEQRRLLVEALKEYEKAAASADGGVGAGAGLHDGDQYKQRHWLPVGYSGLARRATESTGWQLAVWQRDGAQNRTRGALLAAMGMAYSATQAQDLKVDREFAFRAALEAYPDFIQAANGLAMELSGPAQIVALKRVVELDPNHPTANNLLARHHAQRGEAESAEVCYDLAGAASDMRPGATLPPLVKYHQSAMSRSLLSSHLVYCRLIVDCWSFRTWLRWRRSRTGTPRPGRRRRWLICTTKANWT